jgi:hypothetical protein
VRLALGRERTEAVAEAPDQQTENGSERDLARLCGIRNSNDGFGLLPAVTVKSTVSYVVTPCRQPDVSETSPPSSDSKSNRLLLVSRLVYFFILMFEAIGSSEKSGFLRIYVVATQKTVFFIYSNA